MTVHHDSTHDRHTGTDRPARLFATVTGALFLLVGIAGFIPGLTTGYDSMELAGHESHAKLLGIFQVSTLHNVVHLLFGVIGLASARKPRTAISFLVGGGAVYLVLWIYGLLVPQGKEANFVPLNDADNWLHLGLGLAMIAMGLVAKRALDAHAASQRTR